MCEFHDSNCNGFGDMWWTDKRIYFSSIDVCLSLICCESSPSSLACLVIWDRRYRLLASISILPCLLHCALSTPHPASVTCLLHASFNLRFGRPLIHFPGMATSSILLTMCSPFILLTWPYHFRRVSVIFLIACTTLVVFISGLIPPCHSAHPSQHPHLIYF